MSLSGIVQSSGWKNFMAKLYGIGASVVIVGALFKIQHWAGAGIMLTVGLLTEAIIFFFSAFEPLHEEIDWTLVYPELAGIPEEGADELAVSGSGRARDAIARGGSVGYGGGGFGGGAGSEALIKFDQMLESGDITPELFHNLGIGMKKLSEATSNINAMHDIAKASNDYSITIKGATESLGKLSESYQSVTKVVSETGSTYKTIADNLTVMHEGSKSYKQQLEALNKNLSALNASYELQKKGADNHIKESESLYQGLQSLMKDLTESSGDTKKYREQVSKLNDNLAALNNVYGNMLAAMNVK